MKVFSILMGLLLAHAQVSWSAEPRILLGGKSAPQNFAQFDQLIDQLLLNRDYQIGGEWGKKSVTQDDLRSSENFSRMAHSTAKVRSATGFYLGQFNGQYVVATNHHVCPSAENCRPGLAINFTLLGVRPVIKQFYGTWPEIDLAMFSIQMSAAEAEKLNAVATPFSFNKDTYHGQKLLTIGHGVANNPGQALVANQDSDCMVYSDAAEYRLMADPDDFNPGPYRAWSFSNGCDVSHGDSGSAMMDRETGEVVGIIWTGKIPKSQKVQTAEYMTTLFENPNEDVWEELSFAVPAAKMKTFLATQIEGNQFPPQVAETIRMMLNN